MTENLPRLLIPNVSIDFSFVFEGIDERTWRVSDIYTGCEGQHGGT